jgi:hypothetical protein
VVAITLLIAAALHALPTPQGAAFGTTQAASSALLALLFTGLLTLTGLVALLPLLASLALLALLALLPLLALLLALLALLLALLPLLLALLAALSLLALRKLLELLTQPLDLRESAFQFAAALSLTFTIQGALRLAQVIAKLFHAFGESHFAHLGYAAQAAAQPFGGVLHIASDLTALHLAERLAHLGGALPVGGG